MRTLSTIILIISGIRVFAQEDRIDSLLNDLIYNDNDLLKVSEKPVKFDFIFTGASFNSNTFYAGREVSSSDMYNASGHVFYYSSTGLFAGASGIWFDQLTPGYSTTTLSAGYSKAIGKKKLFTFRTSYSRFLYYKPDTGSEYPYKNNFNLGLTFRKKWIGARISPNLLFGDDYKLNISAGIFSRITLLKLGKYNKIYSSPELSAFFSTETVDTRKSSGQNAPIELEDVYSLMNTQLYIPLGISLGDFDLEFSYSMNFPTTQDVNITYPNTSYFSVSLGYLLPIAKKQETN